MKIKDLFEAAIENQKRKIRKLKSKWYTADNETRYGYGAWAEYHARVGEMREFLKGGGAEKVYFLSDLAVEEPFRGNGIGTQLLNKFVNDAFRKKLPAVLASDPNTKAYPLYIRNGFVDVGKYVKGKNTRVLVKNGDSLFEAPLPPDWDREKFSPRTSFRQMVAYAKERATQVGRGSSRVAFEVPYQGRKTVIKVATGSKGLAQNFEEAHLLDDGHIQQLDIVIPLIDYDTENGNRISWIHTEYAQKLTQNQLERYFGGVRMSDIALFLDYARSGNSRQGLIPDSLHDNEFFQELQDLVINFDIPPMDLARKANWGLYRGKPVIIDLGLTSETIKLYGG